MRKLVARCACGAVSAIPPGPVAPDPSNPKHVIEEPEGFCCQCKRKLDRSKAWWYDLDSAPKPEDELDLLSVD